MAAESTKTLVIVESPTKATKIAGYLGDDYIVESSRGHISDLPTNASSVPAKYKGEKWARLGVDVDHDFEAIYVVPPEKKPTITSLKQALAEADELLLATDGDREGEAIAWHLQRQLKPKVPTRRMVFHEITESAIRESLTQLRDLDMDLVDAQETRRILDRLYGFEVSPVLWRKMTQNLSAGRVQSVATRLVVDRERERIAFRSAAYWDLAAQLDAGAEAEPRSFRSRVTEIGDHRIAQGRDFDARGQLTASGSTAVIALDETAANTIAGSIRAAELSVKQVESKPYTRRPYAPFRTTTMQQEAGRKLGFSAQRAMSVAQDLYEGGYITYMRTDSVQLSNSAISAARAQVKQLFGDSYLPKSPRVYTSKVKNAQEAHEAIRPAGDTFRTPAQTGLNGDAFRLYELIWMRTVASQMADAVGETVTVRIQADLPGSVTVTSPAAQVTADTAQLVASGRTITFHGFLKAYVESVDDGASDDQQTRLPQLTQGQSLSAEEVIAAGHETRPPARYTEPSLVAKLEELEIGRPSTYASILRTITARDYVFKRGAALVPTWLAFAVTRLLEEHFTQLVDYDFTAKLEQTLDQVAGGNAERVRVLSDFYFGDGDAEGLKELTTELGDIDARKISTFGIGDLDSGLTVRVGRYGTIVEQAPEGDGEGKRAAVPDDLPPDELTVEKAKELLARPMGEERELGLHPDTHRPIVARSGRFGPYVTEVLAEDAPKGTKPRTGSLFSSMDLDTIDLDTALKLLSLPRTVGELDGETVTAQNGRYGPYLKKGSDSRSLETEEQIFTVTIDQAKAIYDQPKRRGRAAAKPPLKELGNDPNTEKPMVVKDGRFGPYVTDGETMASLRRGDDVETITPERGAELLAEKRAKGPAKKAAKKAPAKKAAAKKSTAKKTTAKKTAKKAPAKKTAAKKTTAKKATSSSSSGS
ncbi:type I DNA topoisomerase [Naumannella halotolerans]|uniref:type I DNA topoisomerase n=1 Tax=Naumannella halotolerans TaxID=993414 RepID=UPI00370D10A0